MALSYLQEAKIGAGLASGQHRDMKSESEKESVSPPLNNNTTPVLYSNMGNTPAALSILTPEQLLAASRTAALMAAGIPVSLHATLVATPGLYPSPHHMYRSWTASDSSPPSPILHSPGPVSPALSIKSRRSNNNLTNNNNNNNNIVNASGDRISKKSQGTKRKSKSKSDAAPTTVDGTAPASPPTSISPEVGKDGRDKVFTCGVCSRSFGYKHVLQNHERTHTGEKPFECPECHKKFTRDHHLKTHMRLHTGEKPYHCNHCDRQFVQVANLRRHLRVHTGERPYACEQCPAKFSDSNQLKAHLLIHKNEKPFECEHCQMRFRRRHHLMHHKCGVGPSNPRPQVASLPLANENLDDDANVNLEAEEAETPAKSKKSSSTTVQPAHRQLPNSVVKASLPPVPLNFSSTDDIPEQTEPEDLSMSTGMNRPNSRSNSSGTSTSSVHEDNEEHGDRGQQVPTSYPDKDRKPP